MKKNLKNRGITLISLVITIVILLILAGISIAQLTGNGLFENAKSAKEKYKNSQDKEDSILKEYEELIGNRDNTEQKSDFYITTPYVGTSQLTVKVDKSSIKETIKKYIYIVGEKVIESEDTEILVTDLQSETNYDITVVAVTNDNKHLIGTINRTTEKRTYLYNNGDKCESITGGWKAEAIGYGGVSSYVIPTLTFNNNNVQMSVNSSYSTQGGSLLINNDIDYSQYKKIGITYTATLGRYSDSSEVGILGKTGNYNEILRLCYTQPIAQKTSEIIDISKIDNFNGFAIYVQSYSKDGQANCNIYEVWLEK